MRGAIAILMVVTLLLCTVAFAEDLSALPGLVQEDDRIVGTLDMGQEYPLQVDMPIPKEVAETVKQYSMRRIEITTPQIHALLKGKTQQPLEGEDWEIWSIDRTEYRQFIYQETSLAYTPFYTSSAPIPFAEDKHNAALDLANRQATTLLDAWGIPYESPFYQACNTARCADVSLRGVPIRTGAEMAKYLLDIKNIYAQDEFDFCNGHKLFDDEYLFVRARQQLNGIPFAIQDIKSPNYRSDNPQFDEGIYMLLQFNSRGEIVFADACNLHEVVEEIGESQTILSWQECLSDLQQNTQFLDRLLEAKVVGAELCYAINEKHITYPVWQFVVEFKQFPNQALQQYMCFAVYVDACSGIPL